MVTIKDISFGHTDTPLYEGVNFVVGKGQKVGLVGPNGSGKTTLLKIITGTQTPITGNVEVLGTIGYVPQEIKRDEDMDSAASARAYVDSQHQYSDHEIKRFLTGLELEIDLGASPKKFSGGQKTKLALARALLSEPDILLLDEPTNFMDTTGKRWVMSFLSQYPKTVILISHDLKLMDNAIDKILAVDPGTQAIKEYKGNYSDYIRLKEQREALIKRELLVKVKHLKRMEEGYQKLGKFDSKRTVWRRRIERERLALPKLPPEVRKISIRLPEPARVGELPIHAKNISKSYGELEVLKAFDFVVYRGERVALIGPNGSGKSTLIKILMDIVKPDSGEVKRNDQLNVGYYSQEFETFDLSKTVLDTFIEKTHAGDSFARGFLGRFMFMGDKVFQTVESLSGGEKTRLSIAILTAQPFNLLILDEPTTYLDVLSQRLILESLKEYKGSMLIVSHTPEFLKELAPARAYLFPEQKAVYWEEELLDKVEEM